MTLAEEVARCRRLVVEWLEYAETMRPWPLRWWWRRDALKLWGFLGGLESRMAEQRDDLLRSWGLIP